MFTAPIITILERHNDELQWLIYSISLVHTFLVAQWIIIEIRFVALLQRAQMIRHLHSLF